MGALLLPVLALAALVTSTISGILGMAGGVALLGIMAALLPAEQVIPLHGVVQLGSNLSRTAAFLRHVKWSLVAAYAPTLVLGVAVAAGLYRGSSLAFLRPGIGAFLLFFVVWRRRAPRLRNLPRWSYAVLGFVVGVMSIFVGATGPLIAPFFLRDDLEKEEVIATKAAVQTLGHLLKLPAFLALGFPYGDHLLVLGVLLICVVVGTLLGKRILAALHTKTFVVLFEITLVGLALHLLVSGLLL